MMIFFMSRASLFILFLRLLRNVKGKVWSKIFLISNKPDHTEGSADRDEGSSNGECSPVEKVLQVSPTSPTSTNNLISSYFGDTDEDGGVEVGQLEIELKPGLTRRLNDCRQTVKRKLKKVNPKRKPYQLGFGSDKVDT